MSSPTKTPRPALSGTPLQRGPKPSPPMILSGEEWRAAPGCGRATPTPEMCNVLYYRLADLP
jgi:hypothetical protein